MGTTIRGIKGLDNYSKSSVIILHGRTLRILKPILFLHLVHPLILQAVSFIIIRLIIIIFLIKMY
jgi:hypothetical protein